MNEKTGSNFHGRQASPAPAKGQHLRIHQPHDAETAAVPTGAMASAVDRHELASVVSKVACRLRQQAATATMHCGMLARRLHDDLRDMTILNEVVEAVHALETLVDGLADYAADQPAHCEPVALGRLVAEILESMRERLKRQQVTVEVGVPQTLTLDGDRRMLGAAVRNLAVSALSTMPMGGQLVITAVATPKGIELEVADSGPGLHENELARAFTPLRSTAAGASGLELAIAAHVAAAHGGTATAQNCPEGGAALTLLIPHRPAQEAAA